MLYAYRYANICVYMYIYIYIRIYVQTYVARPRLLSKVAPPPGHLHTGGEARIARRPTPLLGILLTRS